MCFSDEGAPPRSAVVALGTRAYLGLLENEELVPGHCRIVPIQHHFTSLEADDETWDEIKVSFGFRAGGKSRRTREPLLPSFKADL